MVSRIRELLNKIKWYDKLNPEDFEVHILHRGAPNDVKVIPATNITEVLKNCFKFRDQDGNETVIPYHRVLLIRDRVRGYILYEKVK
ncbi:MAG: RNA repair domain-containing protein [Candidatus Nezhaarchaeota archaeon]|nr:RNA repair domain-containing protein [Candidatus Nezhaarchaeota archaeon]